MQCAKERNPYRWENCAYSSHVSLISKVFGEWIAYGKEGNKKLIAYDCTMNMNTHKFTPFFHIFFQYNFIELFTQNQCIFHVDTIYNDSIFFCYWRHLNVHDCSYVLSILALSYLWFNCLLHGTSAWYISRSTFTLNGV